MKALYLPESLRNKPFKKKVYMLIRDLIYYAGTGAFYTILHFAFNVKERKIKYILNNVDKINKELDLFIVNTEFYLSKDIDKKDMLIKLGKLITIPKILYIRSDRTEYMPKDVVLNNYDIIIKEHPYKDLNRYNISQGNKKKIFPSIFISPLDIKRKNGFLPSLMHKLIIIYKQNFFNKTMLLKINKKIYDLFFLGRTSTANTIREQVWKRVSKEKFNLVGGVQKRDNRFFDSELIPAKKINRKKYFELIKQSKINLAIDGYGSMTHRHFEIMGLEEFMISSPSVREFKFFINQEPQEGIHFVVYDNLEDLVDKIKYYLNHPQEREKISKNAKELYDKEYNIKERAKELREFVKNKFNIKNEKKGR